MRRAVLSVFGVVALLLTFAAPVAADTTAGPFRESGTSKYLFSYSVDCAPQGPTRTTCTETGIDVFSISPTELVVCVYTYTYTFSDRTGRGRLVSQESGCSEQVDPSTLDITVSRDQMTATLAATQVTLYDCNQRTCTESRTVTVSAADSGGPVGTYTNRGSFKDGTCTYRYSESGSQAPVSGTLTIDGITMAEDGYASISDFKVQSTCR